MFSLEADGEANQVVRDALRLVLARGSFFTGSERRAIAEHARRARGLVVGGTGPSPLLAAIIERIAERPWESRHKHVEQWVAAGNDVLSYVEIVSVVSAICAIDSMVIGLGDHVVPLPVGEIGMPRAVTDTAAAMVDCWVPTVGPASATKALSALPAEMAINRFLQDAWYLSDAAIFDFATNQHGDLDRGQIEYVAARTSEINDCFY